MAVRLDTNGTLTVDFYLVVLVVGLTASVTITIGVPVKRAIIIIGSGRKQYRSLTKIQLATYFTYQRGSGYYTGRLLLFLAVVTAAAVALRRALTRAGKIGMMSLRSNLRVDRKHLKLKSTRFL